MEAKVIDKVGEAISKVNKAKHVDDVVLAIHSLALLLFPLDSSALSGSINEKHRDQILNAKAPSEVDRCQWRRAFYDGTGFSTISRVLLHDVTSNWLACFPISARKLVYDAFFVHGYMTEVVQALVQCLQNVGTNDLDVNAIRSNAERLILLCLIENDGVAQMAREYGSPYQTEDSVGKHVKATVSLVAQIVASIPDKVQMGAPVSLSSHLFFKQITNQILSLSEEKDLMEGTNVFVGEIFSRICRRGSVDVLVSEIVPRVLRHVQNLLTSIVVSDIIESNPASQFWLNMMMLIKDSYAIERMSEQLLRELATQRVSDVEAYWILWLLFHRALSHQALLRSMFADKFLLWKVFPVRCLRWIIHFSLLESPPDANSIPNGRDACYFLDAVQRLLSVWSKRDFVQSTTMEQQMFMYVTAAIGLSLEKMSKEQLDEIKDVMHLILQGVSSRLESPNHLVRKMASNVALVFSKVIDPSNPLYLDGSCDGEAIDWEFGSASPEKVHLAATNSLENSVDDQQSTASVPEKDANHKADDNAKRKNKKLSEYKLTDPDEVVDPVTLNCDSGTDEDDDDNGSENSDTSSDSSLLPYDLSDNDADLKRNFTQLVDVVGALRKPDNADGVEKALDVAEDLIRASPDELRHVAGELVRTLAQVRCSDLAVEGEEESAEDKRQRALIALVVMSPFESLETLNKLLYSPTVDVSQRIMILDVMTNAAQELAFAKTMKPQHQTGPLITTISETQAWFLPSDVGPPGAGLWQEISDPGTLLNWANRYARVLPPKPGQIRKGKKTRRWSGRSAIQDNQTEWSHNRFPMYAAAFMLPAMQGFDKRRQGVDLLGRDFIVLGKLVFMLGVCVKCTAMHPEASTLASPLLDMLRTREVCNHKEVYVRKAVLFSASCVLSSLHPTYVAISLAEGNLDVSKGLEWVRTWVLHVAETDTDRECYTMAMACLQLHSEMALQASRTLEFAEESRPKVANIALHSHLSKATIAIPYSNTLQ